MITGVILGMKYLKSEEERLDQKIDIHKNNEN
jgi:hypothetical protein